MIPVTPLGWVRLIGGGLALAAVVGAVLWLGRAVTERDNLKAEVVTLTSDMDAERECASPSLCRQRAAETAAKAALAVLPFTQAWAEELALARVAQRQSEARRVYEVQQLAKRLQEASQRDDSCGAWLRAPVPCPVDELLGEPPAGGGDRPADSGDGGVPDRPRPPDPADDPGETARG